MLRNYSGGWSDRVRGGGARNMKSMRPSLSAIFCMTYFHRAGGWGTMEHGPPRPPRIRYWITQSSKPPHRQYIVLRVCLHQASESTLRQICDDASNTALIEINGDAWKWVANPFWSVIAELHHYIAFCLERHRRRVTDVWCKRTLSITITSFCGHLPHYH